MIFTNYIFGRIAGDLYKSRVYVLDNTVRISDDNNRRTLFDGSRQQTQCFVGHAAFGYVTREHRGRNRSSIGIDNRMPAHVHEPAPPRELPLHASPFVEHGSDKSAQGVTFARVDELNQRTPDDATWLQPKAGSAEAVDREDHTLLVEHRDHFVDGIDH